MDLPSNTEIGTEPNAGGSNLAASMPEFVETGVDPKLPNAPTSYGLVGVA